MCKVMCELVTEAVTLRFNSVEEAIREFQAMAGLNLDVLYIRYVM